MNFKITAFFIFTVPFYLGAGCHSSKISANSDALIVHGNGNIVPFSRRDLSVAEQRADLMSPTHRATRSKFESIWGEAEKGWVPVDSPISSQLQIAFKLYNCLLKIVNRSSGRTALIKDLRERIKVIAEHCPDDQVPVLTGVKELLEQVEVAISSGGLHNEVNLDALRAHIELKRDNADVAYSLRWDHGERRFSQVEIR